MGRDAEQHVVPVGPSSAGWGDKNANPFGGGGALSKFFSGSGLSFFFPIFFFRNEEQTPVKRI